MYSVLFSKKAESQFRKIEKNLQRRIIASLERIIIRPHHFVKKLIGNNYYSLRVGNYRIILDIKNKDLIIIVIELGYRRKIYGK